MKFSQSKLWLIMLCVYRWHQTFPQKLQVFYPYIVFINYSNVGHFQNTKFLLRIGSISEFQIKMFFSCKYILLILVINLVFHKILYSYFISWLLLFFNLQTNLRQFSAVTSSTSSLTGSFCQLSFSSSLKSGLPRSNCEWANQWARNSNYISESCFWASCQNIWPDPHPRP